MLQQQPAAPATGRPCDVLTQAPHRPRPAQDARESVVRRVFLFKERGWVGRNDCRILVPTAEPVQPSGTTPKQLVHLHARAIRENSDPIPIRGPLPSHPNLTWPPTPRRCHRQYIDFFALSRAISPPLREASPAPSRCAHCTGLAADRHGILGSQSTCYCR